MPHTSEAKKHFFMHKALLQAKKALKQGEVPVGVVIVNQQGIIIAQSYNRIEHNKCQTAHAEIRAIQKACKKLSTWRLNGCWIYVTLEPCLMCLGLISLSRFKGIIFGAPSTLFGSGLADSKNLPHYTKELIIEGGIKAKESTDLLQEFFKKVRRKGKGTQ